MDVRVLTLRYQEGTQGFPEGALRQATAGREVLDVREHFFQHGNVPHMALVLLLGDGPTGPEGFRPRDPNAPNPEEILPEERRPFYRDLKRWRNERAKADGKPAYAIARNAQLAEIVLRAPQSLADLKEVAGIGEGFCRDYGAEVLDLVRNLPGTGGNPDGVEPVPPEGGNGGPASTSASGAAPA